MTARSGSALAGAGEVRAFSTLYQLLRKNWGRRFEFSFSIREVDGDVSVSPDGTVSMTLRAGGVVIKTRELICPSATDLYDVLSCAIILLSGAEVAGVGDGR